jgi:predicted nucleic acid-binding protein
MEQALSVHLSAAHPEIQHEIASDEEVLEFIQIHKIFGKGLGWIDCHLLASAALSDCKLWTLDKALKKASHTILDDKMDSFSKNVIKK